MSEIASVSGTRTVPVRRLSVEQELRETRYLLAKVQEVAHLGSWTWDLPTGELTWSQELVRLFGVNGEVPSDFDGLLQRVHPDDREPFATGLQETMRGPNAFELEHRIVRADGHVRWVRTRADTIQDAEGAPARILGTCLDMTEARRAQEGLIRLAAIVQDSSDAMYTKSVDGRITEWNPAAERLYGWTREEILNKPIQTLVPEDRVEEEKGILARVMLGERIPPFETERLRKDGSCFPVSISVSPLRNEASRIIGASTVARDITERRQQERELAARAHALARLTEALARSNRELDQFAYITSHDLKAPLRGIANLSRWIEEDAAAQLSDESRQHLELLRGRVLRMEALIDAILEYSRVGRVRTQPAAVDVGQLLAEVVDLLAPPPGFRIEAAGTLPTVVTERMRLQQVLMNLLSNAVKHHHRKENARVVVSAEDVGAFVRFRVQDDGPGIPARFHEKIFVLFQTLEPRDKVEGTGIGLALVKKIVEGYGGSIAVESEPGRGSAFIFTWPKAIEGANAP